LIGSSLTVRERLVLELLADGNTVRAVARMLGVSERDIGRRRAAVLVKLGARSTAQAVAIAYRTGALGDGPVADLLRQLRDAGYRLALIPIEKSKETHA
jgi:DNA-binding CsgD family transcriptional regulator